MPLIALALCIVMNTLPGMAQEKPNDHSAIGYGVKLGMTSSGFYQKNLTRKPHTADIAGLTVGAYADYGVLSFIDISAELLYLQQGGSRTEIINSWADNSPVVTTAYTRLHNLEANLLVKLSLPRATKPLKPHLLLGPGVGYNITAVQQQDITYDYGGYRLTGSGSEDVRADFISLQYGLYAGLGADIDMGSQQLSIDLRYRYGLSPINNGYNPFNELANVNDFSSNSWMVTIGYQIK